MLSFLTLQTQTPTSPAALAGLVLSGVALVITILQWLRRESREDGATVNQRLKKLETTVAGHETRHTGHSQELQTLADTLGRDIQQVAKDAERRCDDIEKRTERLPSLGRELVQLAAELKRLERIEKMLDDLTKTLAQRH